MGEPAPHEMSDREICDWIVETCLTFGAATHTAYKVAGLFIEGIRGDAVRSGGAGNTGGRDG